MISYAFHLRRGGTRRVSIVMQFLYEKGLFVSDTMILSIEDSKECEKLTRAVSKTTTYAIIIL